MSSSGTSIEGYNFALIIAGGASLYQWVYGLKDKSEQIVQIENGCITTQSATFVENIDSTWQDQAGELKSTDLRNILNLWVCSSPQLVRPKIILGDPQFRTFL